MKEFCMKCNLEIPEGKKHLVSPNGLICYDCLEKMSPEEWVDVFDEKLETTHHHMEAAADELEMLGDEQRGYADSKGGLWRLKEADDVYNDYNRKRLQVAKKYWPDMHIGAVNDPLSQGLVLEKVKDDNPFYNFCCEFAIPRFDKVLKELIENWRSNKALPANINLLVQIQNRIKMLGGEIFVWY